MWAPNARRFAPFLYADYAQQHSLWASLVRQNASGGCDPSDAWIHTCLRITFADSKCCRQVSHIQNVSLYCTYPHTCNTLYVGTKYYMGTKYYTNFPCIAGGHGHTTAVVSERFRRLHSWVLVTWYSSHRLQRSGRQLCILRNS